MAASKQPLGPAPCRFAFPLAAGIAAALASCLADVRPGLSSGAGEHPESAFAGGVQDRGMLEETLRSPSKTQLSPSDAGTGPLAAEINDRTAQAGFPAGAPGFGSRAEGFEEALRRAFPMTPDMVRRYREIFEENERAIREIPEPKPLVEAEIVMLEPGDPPPSLRVSPGIASVIGFFDAFGNPWAIRQHVVGNGDDYRIVDLGEGTNSLAISPAVRVGWTNLVVVLEDEPLPVVARVIVDRKSAHFRHEIRVLRRRALEDSRGRGSSPKPKDYIRFALDGFGLPDDAARVPVRGAQASAWLIGDDLYVRSAHTLVSPPWTETASSPDGVHAYRLSASPVLLFSIGGAITRADVELP